MPNKLQVLEGRVRRIKAELNQLGELRPGALSEQYNVCGKPGCRCKASPPEKHGPYYQLSWSRNGVTEHPNPATEEHLKSGHFG